MTERTINKKLRRVLKNFSVVLLVGARQVGKTTLVRHLDRNYIVFDDITQLNSALNDPAGYINSLKKPVTLDEIQKASFLLTSIKQFVDNNDSKGMFLLTGSANVLNIKGNNETLAGRLAEMTLFPFSCKEKNGKPYENPIDNLFEDINNIGDFYTNEGLDKSIIAGGYPVAFQKENDIDRSDWFNAYISTYIERDIRLIGELRDIDYFIRFYNILMLRSGCVLNKSDIAKSANLNILTVENYISLLEKIYQIYLLKPYSSNISKRYIKTPKVYLTDSGLFCHLVNVKTNDDLAKSQYKGAIFETFVFSEILKHTKYSDRNYEIYFYGTHEKEEIDFILESYGKKLAIEVKATQTIEVKDFKNIISFQKTVDKDCVGIIFYIGNRVTKFGDNLFAIPLGFLL